MSKKAVIITIVVVLLLLLVGGGFYISKRGGNTPTPTPEGMIPVSTEAPTETPAEQNVDVSKFKIKVLNGTAVSGLAAKMQTALEKAGFTVSGTGNADTKDFQTVQIQAKQTVPTSVISKLKDEIGKTYTVGPDKALDSSDENDIVVILGTKSLPTATPGTKLSVTPAPTGSLTATPAPTATSAPTPTQTKTP